MDDLRIRIEMAMAALHSQRATMGEELFALALAPLQAKLDTLHDDGAGRELRHVTVLFTDVVGSTSLAESLDPEEAGEVMDGALARFTAIVEQHRGRVLQYAGDSLLALFGAPVGREDDAERAVRAGLAIVDEARALASVVQTRYGRTGFNVRVGIHTGDVLVGGGVDGDNSVRGVTTHVAARMEQSAPPGTLRVSQDTYRHVRGKFRLQEQPPLEVKGCSEPVRSYLVDGLQDEPDWMAMRGVDGIVTPLIGRDGQLGRLQALWAATSEAQPPALACVTVVGEAGLGKSRLVAEFRRALGPLAGAVRWLEAHSGEQHMGRPYHMLRAMLSGPIGLRDSDPAVRARERWLDAVGPMLGSLADAAVLGHLLGLDFSDEPELGALRSEARQLRDRAFFHGGQLLAAWARLHGPLIAWLDDLHWVDDGTLDFLEHLMVRCPELPLLVVALARPSFYERRPGWDHAGPRQHRIDLAPLDPGAASEMADVLLRRLAAPAPDLHALLTTRGEGNPFYMEELVNMLLDRRVIETTDVAGWQHRPERLQALRIPSTLVGVLQARLDALDETERRTAQLASIVGFRFWDDSLLALGAGSAQALKGLVERELVVPRHPSSLEGANEYAFKHHTLHQVAYDSVLKRHKPALHAKVARWLLSLAGTTPFDLVAEHAERGGDRVLAADCWQRAAEAAAIGYANAQVLSHAERALALVASDDLARRYALTLLRCRALEVMSDRDRLAGEVGHLIALAEACGDPGRQSEALCRQARNHYDRGEAAVALDIARQALLMDPDSVDARALVARCLLRLGRHADAEAESLAALSLARSVSDRANEARILNDLGVLTLERGDPSAAALLYRQALDTHRSIGNRANEGGTLNNLGYVALMLGNYPEAVVTFGEARDLFARIGHRQNEGITLVNLAMARLLQGHAHEALADAQASLGLLQATGDRWAQAAAWRVIGQAELERGEADAAARAFTASRDLFHDMGMAHLALEAIAGLAAAALQRGETAAALAEVETILQRRAAGVSLEGTEEPARVQWVCHQVLAAVADCRADDVLREACASLLAHAERIADAAHRRSFLEGVPHHREMLAAWHAVSAGAAATGS